ncbi:MAG: helix-turn-helix transcriptional regulator [Flavobacteriales bacterium]
MIVSAPVTLNGSKAVVQHRIPAPFNEVVRLFWQTERVHWPYRSEVIVPKGLVEVIFDLSPINGVRAQFLNTTFDLPRVFLTGYNTRSIRVHVPRLHNSFGVVLHPSATKRFFGVPARECVDHCLDLTLVDPGSVALWHEVAMGPTFEVRQAAVFRWIQQRYTTWEARERAMDGFLSDPRGARLSVTQLADHLCWSTRQLGRRMHELTGMNTEQLLLYKKHLHALDLIHHSARSLTEIAYSSGFADQAHFTRSFKSLAGVTPKMYRAHKGAVVGHFNEDVR